MRYILLSLVFLLTATAVAQEVAVTNANLTGKWELHDMVNSKLSKEELQENMSLLEGTFLELKADGTCVVSIILDLEGTWELDQSGRSIITKTRRGERIWKIESLAKDQLIVSPNEATHQLIFKRV